ncbi:hypothetical protein [Thermacetogenium phaeum]|uniref:hypothetical protein n=1 Tax=Thermacetogenium phaeum TaxID=85874 RepID=UPI0011D1F955|nr:hypothetical protein [Thermacetogenium phaeum]
MQNLEGGRSHKKSISILVVVCLLLSLAVPVAYSHNVSSSRDNLSPWDILLQNNADNVLPLDEGIKEFNKNKAIADQQKAEAEDKALQEILQRAKAFPISSDAPGTVSPAATQIKYWTWFPYRSQSKGGSGVGWSNAYWPSIGTIYNGSRAEIYGSFWAKAWGYDYYIPSTTGNYSIITDFNVTGSIWSGSSLAVRVKVADTTNGQTITRTIFNPTSGYFDNQRVTSTEQFYLYAGHRYSFMFETETNAGAVVSATMADFYSKEFDGTQRKIVFNSMGLYRN